MLYVANAFSIGMLSRSLTLRFTRTDLPLVREALIEMSRTGRTYRSVVGHEDTAFLFTSVLGFPVEFNRVTYAHQPGDELLVGQYKGPRLPVGAVELPEGAAIEWWFASQV